MTACSHSPGSSVARQVWWPKAKRVISLAFFIAVLVMLVLLAKNVDWAEVVSSLRKYSARTLLLAGLGTLLSYLAYACFDILGRSYTRHPLPTVQILTVTFVCYAFNLNLSAVVGGIALRYRLYARLGLKSSDITRIFSLSLMTNWLGYLFLGGVVFAMGLVNPPADWAISAGMLRLVGVLLVAVAVVYLLLCAVSRRRSWRIRGFEIELPSLRLASCQIVLGALNWGLMAAVVWVLLYRVDFPTVLGVLLVASIAGVIAHIPAGLGVLETVFVALLQHQVPKSTILAALIGYRVMYFLLPLLLAGLVYIYLEAKARQLRKANQDADER